MDQKNLISKKDLLKSTGISYGQLYRWKRKKIIPEDWFIKKSSFTGQETFFPREKILERIQIILEMKDKYSLDDIAEMILPSKNKSSYSIEDVENIIDRKLIQEYTVLSEHNVDILKFKEIVFIFILKDIMDSDIVTEEFNKQEFLNSINTWISSMDNYSYQFTLAKKYTQYVMFILKNDTEVIFDNALEIIKKYDIESIVADINKRL